MNPVPWGYSNLSTTSTPSGALQSFSNQHEMHAFQSFSIHIFISFFFFLSSTFFLLSSFMGLKRCNRFKKKEEEKKFFFRFFDFFGARDLFQDNSHVICDSWKSKKWINRGSFFLVYCISFPDDVLFFFLSLALISPLFSLYSTLFSFFITSRQHSCLLSVQVAEENF